MTSHWDCGKSRILRSVCVQYERSTHHESNLMRSALRRLKNKAIVASKKLWYGSRGEPITLGTHRLRYVVGSRPTRLKYATSPDIVARNDAQQMAYFIKRVRPGQLVLDVGGHVGQYAVLFAALVGPAGRVVTFEPDAEARPTLRANLELNKFQERVSVEEVAAFDSVGERELFARHGNSQSSLARAGLGGSPGTAGDQRYPIRTVTLDEYLRDAALSPPSYVKLDVEGAEINVLRGAIETMRSKALFVCELHPYAWAEFGTTFEELLDIVARSGRTIDYLDPDRRLQDGPAYGAVIIS